MIFIFIKKYIKKILTCLGLISGIFYGAMFLTSSTQVTEVSPVVYTKIKSIPVAFCKKDGKEYSVEILAKDAGKKSVCGSDTYTGFSLNQDIFATSTPILTDGQYYKISSSTVEIKLSGQDVKETPLSQIQ